MYNLEDVRSYILQFQPAGIIIDTDVLMLLLVGEYDPSSIENCKFTNNFCKADFECLKKIVSCFNKIIITPHNVAEISNHSTKAFYGDKHYAYFYSLAKFLEQVEENLCSLKSLLKMDVAIISAFGFTDMAMFEIAKSSQNKIPILTDDTNFHIRFRNAIPVIKLSDITKQTIRF